jgi:outer membrane protein W
VFSNYHFVIASNKKLDPYAGLALVYSIVNASWSGSGVAASANGNTTDFAGQAGLRYFLKDNLALQGQIGFGYGTLGLGATWKF